MDTTLAADDLDLSGSLRGDAVPVIRVALLAGSPVVRAGLETLLADRAGLIVVGAGAVGGAADAVEAAFDQVAEWDADVVVWVLDAPGREPVDALLRRAGVAPLGDPDGGDGSELLPPPTLGREGAAPPAVVLLADRGDPLPVPLVALRAGARAVLPTDAGGSVLAVAVEAAAAGLTVLPPEAAATLAAGAAGEAGGRRTGAAVAPRPAGGAVPALSGREREVLALLAEGLANKVIGPRLGISEHTVKAHVAAIFEKLGVGTRAEAVVTAARLGLLML